MNSSKAYCAVFTGGEAPEAARALAGELALPLDAPSADLGLGYRDGALCLWKPDDQARKPWCVDFTTETLRRRSEVGSQLLLKAVGGRSSHRIWDTTAGAGRDAWNLASLGFEVLACEREPVIWALLRDGLSRALAYEATAEVAARVLLYRGDALRHAWKEQPAIALYDPMFPETGKSALAKKELQWLQALVGADGGPEDTAERLLERVSHRLVVKRPLKGPALLPHPSHSIRGKAIRFDIYAKQSLRRGAE